MFRVLLVNLLLFLVLVAGIEFFFRLNHSYRFLDPANKPGPYHGFKLNPGEVKQKYGVDLLTVPTEYRAILNYEIPRIAGFKTDDASRVFSLPVGNATTLHMTARGLPPNENQIFYKADYKITADGHRFVDNQNKKTTAKRFFLALGDSFTFGEGTTNGKDYPSQLAKKIGPEWMVYNLGRPGMGPNDMLYKLQTDKKELSSIRQKEGVALWLFIEEHIERFLCTLKCHQYTYEAHYKEKYQYLLNDNQLTLQGRFSEDQRPYRQMLKLAAKSDALRFFNINIPIRYSSEQITTVARSFSEMAKEINKTHQLTKFYVLFYQYFPQRGELMAALKQEEISVIDLTEIPYSLVPDVSIPGDGHPTSNFYWVMTELLKPYFN